MHSKIIYPELSFSIIGILYKAHNKLGKFCNEKQYADLIEMYPNEIKLDYEREKNLPPSFIGEKTGRNKVDFLIENRIILEIKAKPIITKEDYYQIKRYLEAFKIKLGIIVNFRANYIHPKRILNSATYA